MTLVIVDVTFELPLLVVLREARDVLRRVEVEGGLGTTTVELASDNGAELVKLSVFGETIAPVLDKELSKPSELVAKVLEKGDDDVVLVEFSGGGSVTRSKPQHCPGVWPITATCIG